MRSATAGRKAVWLKQHGKLERLTLKSVRSFLNAQSASIVSAVEDAGDALLSINPTELFDPRAWDVKLIQAVDTDLLRAAYTGASDELREHKPKKRISDFDIDLPSQIAASVQQTLDDILAQPYWKDINSRSLRMLSDGLNAGITAGENLDQLQQRIQTLFGAKADRRRAERIARTEVTGALNSGHHAVQNELILDGVISWQEWLSIMDRDVRKTHERLNLVKIGAGEQFNVGGYLAPYPGHHSLPAKERVMCRCTTVGA